jgi:hypothetical protein
MIHPGRAFELLRLYDLESYLFDVVSPRFLQDGEVGAFDFFCIVIWKANRAKSRMARLILQSGGGKDLDASVRELTQAIGSEPDPMERLRILNQRRIRLPMASAVLTVLFPEEFTVYDVRVCEMLGRHHALANKTSFSRIWSGYAAYMNDVSQAVGGNLTLRQKDRVLWAKSFEEQLRTDIDRKFGQ